MRSTFPFRVATSDSYLRSRSGYFIISAFFLNSVLGQPIDQVLASSGWLPPGGEQNEGANKMMLREHPRAALYGVTHKVIEQKSAEAIVAKRPG
ncbi:MAG: hypothetical protein SVW57_10450 [Thermodesulfobacteriota bacterium]|nr:hypothetical protein [Thermodesulfobacteriota bacterium]